MSRKATYILIFILVLLIMGCGKLNGTTVSEENESMMTILMGELNLSNCILEIINAEKLLSECKEEDNWIREESAVTETDNILLASWVGAFLSFRNNAN